MIRARTLGLLASLYLAQGLPYGLFTQALPVLLRERGLSLTGINVAGILFMPWALKFLWAPLVDYTGSRRTWVLSLQLLTFLGALGLSFVDVGRELWLIFAALAVFNLLAATQDIATDGLAVRLLGPAERGLGNGIQVGAYRIGMILGGGALLFVYARTGWSTMFLCMAAILAATCVPALLAPRAMDGPPRAATVSAGRRTAGWIARLQVPGMVSFIALICAYKIGDAMASSLVGPFMHDAGMSLSAIAVVKGTIGSLMGLAGAAAGGGFAFRFGRRRALIGCGVLQTASLLLYVGCALHPSNALIYVASTCEHLVGGMATVALFTLMMDASDPEHAGTDYTLLACAIVIASWLSGFAAAGVGDLFGYAPAFLFGFVVSGVGCAVLALGLDRRLGPERLRAVW